MKPLSLSLLLLPLLLGSPLASAAERCVTYPKQQRIAHGLYLQQFVLRCETVAEPRRDAVQEARDWLALCAEAGGSTASCSAAYAGLRAPKAEDALRVARVERTQKLEPIASPLPKKPAAAGAEAKWKKPGLLTNR